MDHPMAQNPQSPMLQTVCRTFAQDSAFFQMIRKPSMAPPSFGFPLNRIPHYLALELTNNIKTLQSRWIGQKGSNSNVYYDSVARALIFRQPIDYFLCVFAAFLVRDKSEDPVMPAMRGQPLMQGSRRSLLQRVGAMEAPCCFLYEIMLLDYLRAFLPHHTYELSLNTSQTPAVFSGILTDLWFRNDKIRDRLPLSALSALQIVITHFFANPALQPNMSRSGITRTSKSLSRELESVLPHLVALLSKALAQPTELAAGKMEVFISVVQLWLIVIQPWKTPGLYEKLLAARSVPKPGSEKLQAKFVNTRSNDMSLLGLGFAVMNADLHVRGGSFHESWQPYIHQFWNLYSLLRQVLRHSSLKDLIAQFTQKSDRIRSFVPLPFHSMATLCQLMLCFTDPQLLIVLADTQPRKETDAWGRSGDLFHKKALDLEIVEGGRRLWQALKAAAAHPRCPVDLKDGVAVVGRQLKEAAHWQNAHLAPADMPQQSFLASCVTRVMTSVADARASVGSAASVGAVGTPRSSSASRNVSGNFPAPSGVKIRMNDGRLTDEGRALICAGERRCLASSTYFYGSEWEKPIRGSELTPLLKLAQAVSYGLDALRGVVGREGFPDTEWPRLFASWYLLSFTVFILSYRLYF
eukprot:GEMP01030804.1.p1 GENE.GEMP01030804.1~~GEMP01030804.1.p1  ORF type:complete len:713 (-),score=106.12 GEMP01030804.1:66-1976(-)